MTAAIRYIVHDVDAAIGFYQDALGFTVELHPAPGFAALARGDLRLLLNAPGAGGAGTAGGSPVPGGWNRFQITTDDLDSLATDLRSAVCSSEATWCRGTAADNSSSRTPPATSSNSSSPGATE